MSDTPETDKLHECIDDYRFDNIDAYMLCRCLAVVSYHLERLANCLEAMREAPKER